MSIIPRKTRLLLIIFSLFALSLQSQIRIASPYSRFGVGDLAGNTNARNMSMGGLSVSLRNPYTINMTNPASYAAFDSTSFLFEGGFIASQVKLQSNIETSNRSYGSLGYLLFGFPVLKWWHTSIGLTPFSEVGYSIATSDESSYGTIVRNYIGEGGINKFYWGNSFAINKNISVGFNAEYLFGSMQRKAAAVFPDSIYFNNMELGNDITIKGFHFTFGAQSVFKISKDINLNTGATFAAQTNLNASTDILMRTFLSSLENQIFKDTLLNTEGLKGDVVIPMMISGGFSFEKKDNWVAGLDVKWQNWEKFKAFGISDSLVNSLMINAGAEFIPDITNFKGYFNKVRYRIGVTYNNTYLNLRDQRINEYSVSLGFGFPLRGSRTLINVGTQIGSRGTTEKGLIKETYYRFIIGFSIHERWFQKRKYY